MHFRTIRKTGQQLSEIGFGAWGIGGGWGKQDDAEAIRSLHRAFDLGVTTFDTAMVYGDGHSEELIGQALADRRGKVQILTKIAPKSMNWPALPRDRVEDNFPKQWVIDCTEASLKRLKTDYLDLQQFHNWTPGYLDTGDWQEAIDLLKKQGKIRAFGVSANDWDPYNTVSLVRSGKVDAIQVIYNLFEQRPEEELFPAAQEMGVGIIVRVPFEEGLLTGNMGPDFQFDEGDWRAEWATVERRREAQARVEKLKPFLAPDRPTLAALALKFCLSHPAVTTVIPGMRRVKHVEANVAVSDGKLLPPETFEALRQHRFIHGWAYPWAQK